MITVKADDRRRVVLPGAKPRQEFTYLERENGTVILTPVKPAKKQRHGEAGPQPRVVMGKLVKRGNALVMELPPGCAATPLVMD